MTSSLSVYESEYHIIGTDPRFNLPHHDNSIELIQTWSDGGYFIVKNNIFPIKPGNVFLINAMESHYSNPSDPAAYNRSKLILSTELFREIIRLCGLDDFADKNLFARGGSCFTPSLETTRLIDACFDEATRHYRQQNDVSHGGIVKSLIAVLIHLCRSDAATPALPARHTVTRLANYVNAHNDDWQKLTSESICEALHLSPSRVAHLFKELMGKTIIEYKNELRISEAKKLLLSTRLNIYEISDMLGFHNSTVFCKYFKNKVGCTAGQYRDSMGLSIRGD